MAEALSWFGATFQPEAFYKTSILLKFIFYIYESKKYSQILTAHAISIKGTEKHDASLTVMDWPPQTSANGILSTVNRMKPGLL